MTACATVADVLALHPNPARLTRNRIRRTFGGGDWKAVTLIHRMAIDRHERQVAEVMALGVNRVEAEAWLWMQQRGE